MGNPSPVFCSGSAEVASGPRVMKERHISLSIRQGARAYRAVMWRGVEWSDTIAAHRTAIDVAYALERNTYMGDTTVELRLSAVRAAGEASAGVPPAATVAATA
jgi:single-stranded-DNA-specific exonuclease